MNRARRRQDQSLERARQRGDHELARELFAAQITRTAFAEARLRHRAPRDTGDETSTRRRSS